MSETTVSWSNFVLTVLGGTLVGSYNNTSDGNRRIDPNNLSTSVLGSYSAVLNMGFTSNGFSSSGIAQVISIPLRDQVWIGLNISSGIFIFGPCIEFGGVPAL